MGGGLSTVERVGYKGWGGGCLLLKGCLEDFKCKGLQMNPAYILYTFDADTTDEKI